MTTTNHFDGGYFLTHIYCVDESDGHGAAQETSQAAVKLHMLVQWSDVEVQQFQRDLAAVSQYEAAEHLLACVRANFDELVECIATHCQAFAERRTTTHDTMGHIQFDVSRRLSNLLSSFKSVLDHGEAHFCRAHGRNSSQYLTWKQAQKAEFDNVFAYRFFYGLRNFTQHIDMAPIMISFTAEAGDETISARADLDCAYLLREGREKFKHVEEELLAMSEPLSLFELLEPWSASFERLSEYYLGQCAAEALPHSLRLLRLRSQIGRDYGDVAMTFVPATSLPATRINPTIHHVPETAARRIARRSAA